MDLPSACKLDRYMDPLSSTLFPLIKPTQQIANLSDLLSTMCASQNTCPPSWYGVWLHGHWGQVQWGHWTCSWEHRENKLQLAYVLHILREPTEVYCWDTRPRGSLPHHASCNEEPREPCLVRHIRPAEVSSSGFPFWATVCEPIPHTAADIYLLLVFYQVAFQLDITIWLGRKSWLFQCLEYLLRHHWLQQSENTHVLRRL